MLILTRRPGEDLVIETPDGTIVTIKSLGVKGNQTRIGIDAPTGFAVHRNEIWARIQRERELLAALTLFEVFDDESETLHYIAAVTEESALDHARRQGNTCPTLEVTGILWHPDYTRLQRLQPQDATVRDLLHQAIRDGKTAPFEVTLPADLEIAA